jgi:hypothetical protein
MRKKKNSNPPCEGYGDAKYVNLVNKTERTGHCTFPGCGAKVKIEINECGNPVSKLHLYRARP